MKLLSDTAICANTLRAELKALYPNIRVTAFSTGTIEVHYTSPLRKDKHLVHIVNKYRAENDNATANDLPKSSKIIYCKCDTPITIL
jgi:hypothetical protein